MLGARTRARMQLVLGTMMFICLIARLLVQATPQSCLSRHMVSKLTPSLNALSNFLFSIRGDGVVSESCVAAPLLSRV